MLAKRDDLSIPVCNERELYLAVTALTDLATLTINVTSVAFEEI